MKPDERSASHLDLPEFTVQESDIGAYTGFNSVNLQEIGIVRRQAAVRSQIARGWGKPIIVRLPAGKLLASQYQNLEAQRNPAYPEAREEAALCQSEDEGVSWSRPRLLGVPGRSSQFSALGDGTLILATERRAGSSLYRSADEGKTWQRCEIDWERGVEGDRYFGETSGVVELPEGMLLCGFYIARPGSCDSASYIIRSKDGGKTWGDSSLVGRGSEASYALLPDGRLLGVVRTATIAGEGGAFLEIVESRDQGYTWTTPRPVGLGAAQIPGFPLLLKDGKLLLIYGNRQFPFGAQAIASLDFGETWNLDHPILLVWFSWDNYCGHPRSFAMPDGSILTGYYARVFRGGSPNQDIVSHALRWRIPDDWPAPRARGTW